MTLSVIALSGGSTGGGVPVQDVGYLLGYYFIIPNRHLLRVNGDDSPKWPKRWNSRRTGVLLLCYR